MTVHEFTVKEEEVLAYKRRRYANSLLNKAVNQGRIEKPKCCSMCKKEGLLHGHHHDYGQPFNVTWLCPKCHTYVHNSNHALNPELNKQTPMPACMGEFKRVCVSFTIPIREFIALHREAEKQNMPVSELMSKLATKNYPVQRAQLEFEFKEKANDNAQSVVHEGIHSMAADESLLPKPESAVLPKVRGKRNLNLPRVERELFAVSLGHGTYAPELQRSFANR